MTSVSSFSSCRLNVPHGFCGLKYFDRTSICFAPSIKFPASWKQKMLVKRSSKMVMSAYNVGRVRDEYRIYGECPCLVTPPSNHSKPHGIVKFLGGAFIGATPESTYRFLIDLLAKEGFVVVAVPYNVTFDHEKAAKEVNEIFSMCIDMLYADGIPSVNLAPADVKRLPLYSVGHSNGALLQLLEGSYFSDKIPKANAVISYNNRPASEAVPYFEQLGPLVLQLTPIIEASPVYALARTTSADAFKALLDTAGPMLQEFDKEAVASLNKFVNQLPGVMNQVYQGVSEFKPTPSENRAIIKSKYNVEKTLLVKFDNDAIDETDILEEILRPRMNVIGGTLEKVILKGTHITPCAQDVGWQAGDVYTPVDALAQGLKSFSMSDTRELVRTISDWFQAIE